MGLGKLHNPERRLWRNGSTEIVTLHIIYTASILKSEENRCSNSCISARLKIVFMGCYRCHRFMAQQCAAAVYEGRQLIGALDIIF